LCANNLQYVNDVIAVVEMLMLDPIIVSVPFLLFGIQ